jgi:hypothetical protein
MTAGRDQFERARRVPIERVLRERSVKLRRCGAELIGPCPHCGGRDRFGVNLRKQVFVCRGCGARGSVIDLVALLDRCTIHEAVAKLCGVGNPPPARPLSNPQRVYSKAPADCDGTDRALQWWAEARSIAGTLAEEYLVQHRGIGTFPPDVDDVLRFHPRCIFGPGQFYPCLLAMVRDVATDQPQAITRTTLATTAEKIGRMALGPTANGAVKLWPNDCVTTGLVIGEGVETCLAAASMSYRGTLLQPRVVADRCVAHRTLPRPRWHRSPHDPGRPRRTRPARPARWAARRATMRKEMAHR